MPAGPGAPIIGLSMKIPLSWLREYVDLPLPVAELAARLTMVGLEVSSVRVIGLPVPAGLRVKSEDASPVWAPDKIVIGKVLGVERHPDADRLTLATIEYGADQPKRVVTGATNIKVGDQGQKVILALAGSMLFDGHASEKAIRELKPSKIRGIPSDAMVCSAYELGISEEHAGIIILEDDAPVGRPLVDFMGDIVVEVDVLPNMARCLSMIGIAREVAAITGQKVRVPRPSIVATGEPIIGQVTVSIEDPQLSSRYAAVLLRGVKIGPAPGWMQRRLLYAGMRPISNIVDSTNYVMLEWGQPLHAFDFDRLRERAGGKAPAIVVRPARGSEKITTLDGVDRQLEPANLVIADSKGPVAIAGVMGGRDTEVTDATKNILLESASFNFLSIRRTMMGQNLPSEASLRFSRGAHPATVEPAAERAAMFMHDHAGATVCSGMIDCYPVPLPAQIVKLEMSEVRRILGMDYSIQDAARVLSSLEFRVEEVSPKALKVRVPDHRLDIQTGSADLIEELARIHGYDRLPATLLADQLPEQRVNRDLQNEERVRDVFVTLGLQEVITYSLTEPAREMLLDSSGSAYVRLLNPITSERTVMRHSVLASVLEVAATNVRHRQDLGLFEIGFVYLPQPGERFPKEPRRLAVAMTGRRQQEFWQDSGSTIGSMDFFDLKGVIDALAGDLHLPEVTYTPATRTWLHPGRAAEMLIAGKSIGPFGQLHPATAEAYGLANYTILAGELDLDAILQTMPARYTNRSLSQYPAALRDIAVIVAESVTADLVRAEMQSAGGDLLRGIRLFDVYRGESIPPGTKSLAYALTYQAEDRTLTDKEVDKVHKKIEDRLKHVLKARIRGQEAAK
jgi:phenylalanyl-tRNA synthetase beta chain